MAMTAIAQDFWQEQADEPEIRVDGRIDPELEDAYWQSVYWGESYYRHECSYDDYAPAYCVGYIGYAQYGGKFDDAEKSLCANWIRIKGDSRLTLDEAMQAIRAAWEHAALGRQVEAEEDEEELVGSEIVAAQARERTGRQPAYATA
jgi:hypothetical protein